MSNTKQNIGAGFQRRLDSFKRQHPEWSHAQAMAETRRSYQGKTPEARARQAGGLRRGGGRGKAQPRVKPTDSKRPYIGQPCAEFVETHFYIPETKRPIVLLDFEKDILADLFESGRGRKKNLTQTIVEGNPTLALLGMPKKTGKSTLAAMVAAWFLFTKEMADSYVMGPDLQQGQLVVFDKLVKAIRLNPSLEAMCKIRADRVDCEETGSSVQVLPCNASAAGLNPSLVIFDELWQFTSEAARRAWDEMTNIPTREDNLILTVTYAGFSEDEDSILWPLYKAGIEQRAGKVERDPRFYFLWRETYQGVPWVTQEYLDLQKRRLRPSTYARLHENKWTSGEEAFVTARELDLCESADLVRGRAVQSPVFGAVDVGIKHDASAIALVTPESGQEIALVDHALFEPQEGETLDLEMTVEEQVKEYAGRYWIEAVYYDPYQFARSAKTLADLGIPMVEYPQTVNNTVAMSECLQGFLQSGNFRFYADPEVRQHLLNARAIETQRGWRIVKQKRSKKIDLAVALAMGTKAAQDSMVQPEEQEVYIVVDVVDAMNHELGEQILPDIA